MTLKAFAVALGGTGAVGGVVGTTLWQTGSFGGSKAQSTYSSTQTTSLGATGGSCTFIDASRSEIFNVLFLQERQDYKAINCKNTNSSSEKIGNWDQWIGLFPKVLFKSNDDLEAETVFNLETNTELVKIASNDYIKTTFISDKFLNSSVTGMWGDDSNELLSQKITTVKVDSVDSSNSKIFLLLGQDSIT